MSFSTLLTRLTGKAHRNQQITTENRPLQRIRRMVSTLLGLVTFSSGLALDRLLTQLGRLMFHLPGLGRVLLTVLTSPLSLIRAILGVQFQPLLRLLLMILTGSLYASIVGFIVLGAWWIAEEKNLYLGAIVGTFFFSVLTLSLSLLILAVLGRVQNDNT